MLITAQRELEGVLQEAAKLKVNALVPDDVKKVLKDTEGMCVKWEGDHKVKEESAAHKAEEEEALHKGKELACADGEEDVSNEAVHLFNNDASPTCKAEEEEKEPMPTAKLTVKPVPTKQIEFHAMGATPALSPSAHGSTCSMEVVIRVHHGYTPGYWGLTRTRTRDGSVPVPRVRVWSQVPSLVPVPVPAAGIPVGYEQGGRAKVRATQATAQRARWCALYCCFCALSGQGWGARGRRHRCIWRRAMAMACEGVVDGIMMSASSSRSSPEVCEDAA